VYPRTLQRKVLRPRQELVQKTDKSSMWQTLGYIVDDDNKVKNIMGSKASEKKK